MGSNLIEGEFKVTASAGNIGRTAKASLCVGDGDADVMS